MGIEQFEQLGKKIGEFATTTARKAGDQVHIAKLSLDKSGIEKEIEGVYAAIGRYCYTKAKAGVELPVELGDYCADIDALLGQISAIEEEVASLKAGHGDDVIYAEATDAEEVVEAAPADPLDAEEDEEAVPVQQ